MSFSSRSVYPLVLAAIALNLVVPKVVAIEFFNARLWAGVDPGDLPFALAQDLLVGLLAGLAIAHLLRRVTIPRAIAAISLTSGLLLLLLIDMRVRELWLKPLDLDLIRYSATNASDLLGGVELFMNFGAGYGLTFRRLVVYLLALHGGLWLAALLLRRRLPASLPAPPGRRFALAGILALALLVLHASGPSLRFFLDQNLLLRPAFAALRQLAPDASAAATQALAASFEQPPRALAEQARLARVLHPEAAPFENVVLVLYESVRWAGLELGSPDTVAPTLARMAREGTLARAYVSIPHSFKAYYAVLTGRHPYPGVEMREAMTRDNRSLFHALREEGSVALHAFSAVNLAFENMGGLLRSLGFETPTELRDLAARRGVPIAETSSFGVSDEQLYRLGLDELDPSRPFATLFFPIAAHYPYECPGSDAASGSYDAYRNCLAYSDGLLQGLLDGLAERSLLDDTLVVVIGDHGESFGEHGLYVHNSSMYDEEITVPLVFWSRDRRLAHGPVLRARQIDVAPSIADLMDRLSADVEVQGASLWREGGPGSPAFATTFFDGLSSALIEGQDKYIYEPASDSLRHYQLERDPEERDGRRLSGDEARPIVQRLRAFAAHQRLRFAVD